MSAKHLDFEDVLKQIGQFGPWQRKIFGWMCLASIASGLVVVVYVFTGYEPKYRCSVPLCENVTTALYGSKNDTSFTFPHYVMLGVPKDSREKSNLCKYYGISKEKSHSGKVPSTCEEYVEAVLRNDTFIELMSCSHDDLIFDKSVVTSSTPAVYGLTCDSSYLRNIYGSTYMIGLLFGSFFLGIISDKFGRLTALLISIATTSASGFIGAFVSQGAVFAFFRFMTGVGAMGCFMAPFVICVESVGVKYTMLVGMLIEIPFAVGELLLGLEAYFIRDFFTLQLVSHIPIGILLFFWFVVPESPRWLMAMKRYEEAEKIIESAAKSNGRELPPNLMDDIRKQNSGFSPNLHPETEKESEKLKQRESITILNLFYPKEILFRTLNMFFQWYSVTLCYYGLSFSSTSQLGDPYTNFCLSVFIEIPGYLFCVFVMDCWGRRPILSFTQIVSGAACIIAGLISNEDELAGLQLFMSLIGKFGASASFAIVFVYTAELFPTTIRNTAIGSCSTVARIGAISALLIGLLGGSTPMLILGISAIVGGFLALLFPETVGTKLPETIEDAIRIGKDSTRGICSCVCPSSLHEIFSEDSES